MVPYHRGGVPPFVANPTTVESVVFDHVDAANSVSSTALGPATCLRRADEVGWNSTTPSRAACDSPRNLPPPVLSIQ